MVIVWSQRNNFRKMIIVQNILFFFEQSFQILAKSHKLQYSFDHSKDFQKEAGSTTGVE